MKFPAVISRWFAKAAVSALRVGDGWPLTLIRESYTGAFQQNVTVDSREDLTRFSAVYAAITTIAGDVGKLRPMLMANLPNGTCVEVKEQSPFRAVLVRPNSFQNRIQFIQQWVTSKLIYGNTYALKERDARGVLRRLYILNPERVTVLVTDGGDVYYQLAQDNLAQVRVNVTVPASEIIHDRICPLWHPLVGIPALYAGALSATMGNRIQKNSASFFGNQSRPGGYLVSPGKIDDEYARNLKNQWDQNYGGANAGRTAVLANGLKYEPMNSMPAQDAQLVEQLGWTVEDVARCFHIPAYKIGGPIPANTSVESLNQQYYDICLQVHIEEVEAVLDHGLELPPDKHVKFDLDALLRMDTAAMVAAEAEAVKAGIKSPNEARLRMNLPPVKGGDIPYLQQQNYSLEALAKRDAKADPFAKDAKKPAAPPAPPVRSPAANDEDAAARANELAVDLLLSIQKGFQPCAT